MRWLNLFSGAGGTTLGLNAAGHESVGIEWDGAACLTAWAAGHDTIFGDVRAPGLYRKFLGDFDAVWASPPCQPWSSCGKHRGATDERDGWDWTYAVVDEVEPDWLVAENVGGLLEAGAAAAVLQELERRFAWAASVTLDSVHFGVPQNRSRVFFVAGPRRIRWPVATHGGSSLFATLPPFVSVDDVLPLLGFLRAEQIGATGRPTSKPSPTVTTGGNLYFYQHDPGARRKGDTVKGGRRLTPEEQLPLMGWPMDHPLHGDVRQRQRLVGNGVVPVVAQRLAEAVATA